MDWILLNIQQKFSIIFLQGHVNYYVLYWRGNVSAIKNPVFFFKYWKKEICSFQEKLIWGKSTLISVLLRNFLVTKSTLPGHQSSPNSAY